jgi:aminoglycoside 3-N-acetyltransferase
MLAGDAKPFIARAVELGRKGITMYVDPAPKAELFLPRG